MVTTNIPFNIPLFTFGSIYSTYPSGVEQVTETNNSNIIKYNRFKNPNWPETNQLAICKRGRGYELGLAVTAGLELGASELQVRRSNHSATLPPTI